MQAPTSTYAHASTHTHTNTHTHPHTHPDSHGHTHPLPSARGARPALPGATAANDHPPGASLPRAKPMPAPALGDALRGRAQIPPAPLDVWPRALSAAAGRRTCTALASWSTPFSMRARASSPKRRSLPDMWRTAARSGAACRAVEREDDSI
eukprot:scaffold875_cov120-Isochrysis_galbana.AAC.2